MEKRKKSTLPASPADEEVTVTAGAGGSPNTVSFTPPAFEDEWTEAEADAFIDELVARNKEALRGLAKL